MIIPKYFKCVLCCLLLLSQIGFHCLGSAFGMHPESQRDSESKGYHANSDKSKRNCDVGLAQTLVKTQNYTEAIDFLSSAFKQGCESYALYVLRARAFWGLHQAEEALLNVNRAIESESQAAYAYLLRASIYAHLEKTAEAIDDLTTGIGIQPNVYLGFMHAERGLHYLAMDQHGKARVDFTHAIDHGVSVYYERGFTLDWLGYYEEAVKDFSIALKKQEPELDKIRLARGRAYSCLKQFPEALDDLNKVITKHPNDVSALSTRGWIKLKKGDVIGALSDLAHASSEAPNDPFVYLNLGEGYFDIGEFDKAIQANARAMTVVDDLTKPSTLLQKGLFLFMVGQLDEAKKAYEEGRTLSEKATDHFALKEAIRNLRQVLQRHLHLNDSGSRILQSLEASLLKTPRQTSSHNPFTCS